MWTPPRGINRQYTAIRRRRRYFSLSVVTTESISDNLTFSQIVTDVPVHIQSVSQTLTFVDVISETPTHLRTLTQAISFTPIVSYVHTVPSYAATLSQTLTFNQNTTKEIWLDSIVTTTEDCLTVRPLITSQTIIFRDCLAYELTHQSRRIYQELAQLISFIANATGTVGNHTHISLNDILIFSEQINSDSKINQIIEFTQNATYVHIAAIRQTMAQTLTFVNSHTRSLVHIIRRSLTQSISFADSEVNARVRIISQSIIQSFSFNDSHSETARHVRSFSQILSFNEKETPLPNYIDRTTLIPVARAVKVQKLMVLEGIGALTLPAPEWGDAITLRNTMNLRRSMNGKTYTYVRTNDRRLLKYKFSLGRHKSLELCSFLRDNMATPIRVTNLWKGEIWLTKLAETPANFIFDQSSRTEEGRLSVELQLEGVQLA